MKAIHVLYIMLINKYNVLVIRKRFNHVNFLIVKSACNCFSVGEVHFIQDNMSSSIVFYHICTGKDTEIFKYGIGLDD